MLVFVDEPKNIKIVRTAPEEGTRTNLGKINKSVLEIPAELREKLDEVEISETEQIVELMRRASDARLLAEVGDFPAICQRMYEYYEHTADPVERRWILGSVLEILRRVRRLERQQAGGGE
ncbi:hypothetical protein [Caulobacter sp. S45]|uniref:hypothetical protein n=1 Tax=Caulobacter sp. S45 TaxID=1641861 RepID=UPI00157776F8|nr:hypothetical protein [Caulobacter sp. S45]